MNSTRCLYSTACSRLTDEATDQVAPFEGTLDHPLRAVCLLMVMESKLREREGEGEVVRERGKEREGEGEIVTERKGEGEVVREREKERKGEGEVVRERGKGGGT